MKKIKLTQGKFALVDDEDFEWLNQYKWYYTYSEYAARIKHLGFKKNKIVTMQYEILKPKSGLFMDHINCNKLDNRRSNLRKCTHIENNRNKSINKNNTTGFKGVYFRPKLKHYEAYITVNWKHKYLGAFNNKKEAAIAYNNAARKYFREFANLNSI